MNYMEMTAHAATIPESEKLTYFDRPMLIFDLETTGVDPLHDLPVSAALLEFDAGSRSLLENRETYFLIDPGCEIPPAATAIHGITIEQAREEGISLNDAICQIYDTIVGFNGPVVGMNISYDLTMVDTLSRSILDCELPESLMVLDILVLDRHFDRYRRGSRKLADLARTYGVQSVDAHNALGDTTTTANVLMSMMACYPEIARMNPSELVDKQREWHYDWASQYSEWRQKQGKLPLVPGDYHWPVRRYLPR
jgi:DNA polymerase-3 subunit epsilon